MTEFLNPQENGSNFERVYNSLSREAQRLAIALRIYRQAHQLDYLDTHFRFTPELSGLGEDQRNSVLKELVDNGLADYVYTEEETLIQIIPKYIPFLIAKHNELYT